MLNPLVEQWMRLKSAGELDSCSRLFKLATNIGPQMFTESTLGPTVSTSLRGPNNTLRGPQKSIIRPVEPNVKVDQPPATKKNEGKSPMMPKKEMEMKDEKTSPDSLSYQSAKQ